MRARVIEVDGREPEVSSNEPFLTNQPHQFSSTVSEERRAGVNFEANIYDSIVVASFGGVTQTLAKTGQTLVHPFVLVMFSLPLLTMQASTLMFFRLDQDLTRPVWPRDLDNAVEEQKSRMLLVLRVLMMVIVQLVLFGKILGTLRLLVFVLNPSTWDEIERPDPEKMVMKRGAWVFKRGYLAPCAILAMVIHASVNYTVCVDSVSIILASESVKDAIYDSLAITFIADLPVTWWAVVATVCHFDNFDKFEFRLMDPFRANARRNHSSQFEWIRLLQWTRRGYGARRAEVIISFCLLVCLYFRQIFVVVHAMDTNVLPVARDVCTFWRWSTGQAEYLHFTARLFQFFEQHFLVMDPSTVIDALADPDHEGFCNATYDRLHWSDARILLSKHRKETWLSLLFLVIALCLPQVYYVAYHRIRPYFYDDADASELDLVQPQTKELEEQLEDLREEVRSMQVAATIAPVPGDGGSQDGDAGYSALRRLVESQQQALDQERKDRAQEMQALRAEMEALKDEAGRAKKKRGFF